MATTPSSMRVRVPKTAEVVAQTIRSQIVRGEVAEGESLPSEAKLMERFGVSRPSLREAFRILESEQLIEVRRGAHGGAVATRPHIGVAARYLALLMQFDGVLLSEVFQARALIEPLAFRLLAQRKDRQKRTQDLLRILEALNDAPKQQVADIWIEFFNRLFEHAGNQPLALLYGTLTEVVAQEVHDSIGTDSNHEATLRTVAKVMKMVDEGQGDQATDFWRSQMLLLEGRVNRLHRRKTLVDSNG